MALTAHFVSDYIPFVEILLKVINDSWIDEKVMNNFNIRANN